jgi:HEPN domain-containing protein
MIDIHKQIEYWKDGAAEELTVSSSLFDDGRTRHGLFFLHLTIEKILKAHVCKTTGGIAPRSHSLLRLADKTGLPVSGSDREFPGELSLFNIEGRYPEFQSGVPNDMEVQRIRHETERIYTWLLEQL